MITIHNEKHPTLFAKLDKYLIGKHYFKIKTHENQEGFYYAYVIDNIAFIPYGYMYAIPENFIILGD